MSRENSGRREVFHITHSLTSEHWLRPRSQKKVGGAWSPDRHRQQGCRAGRLPAVALHDALDRLSADVEQLVLRDLTYELCSSRLMPLVSTPRSLDLAHLRTAHWFHEQQALTRFVSLDATQNRAAREMGLPV